MSTWCPNSTYAVLLSYSKIVLKYQLRWAYYVHKLTTLEDLASRDLWQSTLSKVFRARSLNLLTNPHGHIICLTYDILALLKLRCFTDSSNELYTLND
ncbi:hypothetical protein PVK06_034165 [Gossypium arboreum]|uniref:Uncharacterized protein n=1 Tax=Gossypium arboreum TaxID=29729 RepID=A0ABR0NDS5_GOSAR|nr:hypothetical protein PVK06_034165 [Gossypium arboreum]